MAESTTSDTWLSKVLDTGLGVVKNKLAPQPTANTVPTPTPAAPSGGLPKWVIPVAAVASIIGLIIILMRK